MSPTSAIIAILVASFAWGSWMQFVKHIKGWSVNAFMTTLYSFSLVLTWSLLGIAHGLKGYVDLFAYLSAHRQFVIYPLLGGFLYTLGMWFSLNAVDLAGLLVGYLICASIGIVAGTGLSILAGGVPRRVPLKPIILACLSILGAVVVLTTAGLWKDQEHARFDDTEDRGAKPKISAVIAYGVMSGLLVCAYPFFMTLSMATPENAVGLDAYQYMAMLSLGSMITVVVLCVGPAISQGGLYDFMKAPGSYYGMAALSSIAHYGGNVLHAVAAPTVGLALAWPLGQTAAVWAYIWGLVSGEFVGVSRRVYVMLALGLGLFALGILILAFSIYS